ncbi:MAG: hypothetical protein ACYCU8_00970 [Ferrimicrobium acidiphilum]
MPGLDIGALFQHPPDPESVLRQKTVAPAKKVKQEEIDDRKPEVEPTHQKAEPETSEWPVFIQKARKGLAERAKPSEPTLSDRETLQLGTGSIAKIEESRLSYNAALWMARKKVIRITDKWWWLPRCVGEKIEVTPWSWTEVKVIERPLYALVGREPVKIDQLVVMVMGKNRRPVVIQSVDPINHLPASARYLSRILDIDMQPNDLFSGNTIPLT